MNLNLNPFGELQYLHIVDSKVPVEDGSLGRQMMRRQRNKTPSNLP